MTRPRKRLHPVAKAIEAIFAAGHTPRLQLDARRKDVEVPDHVRTRWGARLVIDLDPSWPLALEYTPEALEVDLAFQGIVQRCRLGWQSIYTLVDRATGRSQLFRAHLPAETLPPEIEHQLEEPEAPRHPRLTLASSRPPARPEPAVTSEAAAEREPSAPPPAEAEAEAPAPVPAPAGSSSDEEARARRARFRVIAGGR